MEQGQVEEQPDRVKPCQLTIIVPTMDNREKLHKMVNTILQYTLCDPANPYYHIVIVNNGDPGAESGERGMEAHPMYTVIDAGSNLGWEGGLNKGLEWVAQHTQSGYIMFANDDIQILPNDPYWLAKMVKTLDEHLDVAAVGPISNFVSMHQNFAHMLPPALFEVGVLIGFCILVRASMLSEVGGVTTGLPGGDDYDLCLRLRAKGYKVCIQGDSFVHHFGSVTGKKVHGEDWDSIRHISETRNEMIRRHGLKNYLSMLRHNPSPL